MEPILIGKWLFKIKHYQANIFLACINDLKNFSWLFKLNILGLNILSINE